MQAPILKWSVKLNGVNMSIQILKKKPVPVEAVQWKCTQESENSIREFLGENFHNIRREDGNLLVVRFASRQVPFLNLSVAYPTDWVLKDVNGNFYTVENEVILKTYDVINDISDYIDEFGIEFHSGD